MQITPANLNAMFNGYMTVFNRSLDAVAPSAERMAMEVASAGAQNIYSRVCDLPHFREWVGERVVQNLKAQEYTVVNKTYESTFAVDRETIEDDAYGLYSADASMLATGAGMLWHELLISALMNGHQSPALFDGRPFFDTAHPINATGATQSNKLSLALNRDNIIAARAAMMAWKGDSGKALRIRPNKLVVAPSKEVEALEIIQARTLSAGGENVLSGLGMTVETHAELEDEPTAWYLLDDSKPLKPLVKQVRKRPQFVSQTDLSSDTVFHRKTFVFGADARGAAGYGLWFTALRSKP